MYLVNYTKTFITHQTYRKAEALMSSLEKKNTMAEPQMEELNSKMPEEKLTSPARF